MRRSLLFWLLLVAAVFCFVMAAVVYVRDHRTTITVSSDERVPALSQALAKRAAPLPERLAYCDFMRPFGTFMSNTQIMCWERALDWRRTWPQVKVLCRRRGLVCWQRRLRDR
jgi:hypothetical protein